MRVREPSVGPRAEDDEIDFIALASLFWANKVPILLAAILCGGVGLFFGSVLQPVYRAEVVVTGVGENTMGGAASLVGQLGGIASLAGANLSSSSGSQEAQLLLESRFLVDEFVRRNELLPVLAKNSGFGSPLTHWNAVTTFREKVLSIKQDLRKGMTVVSVSWGDSAVAAEWANGIVALANDLLRNKALDESQRNITYLNEQISRTDVVELKRVMYNLIERETQELMLANGKPEYAFIVVDPAMSPELPVSPKRMLILLTAIATGFGLGAAWVLVRDFVGRRKLVHE